MDYLNWVLENENIVFNMITMFLIIVGWFAIFFLGLRQNKKLMKNKAQMKIYEELCELRKIVDERNIDLGVLLSPISLPFVKMKNIKYYPDFNSPYEVWNDYLRNLAKEVSLFINAYRKLWIHVEMWVGIMQELEEMKKIYFEEFLGNLTDELYKHHDY